MKKWEYKEVRCEEWDVLKMSNKAGADGWEVYHVGRCDADMRQGWGNTKALLHLKRQKQLKSYGRLMERP